MSSVDMYWLKDRSAPFATFLGIIQTYYHPEVRNESFDELVQLTRSGSDDPQLLTFKAELIRLLKGDREGLHPAALTTATEYEEWDTDDEFLTWLWHELYPDEPVPGRE